MLYKTDHLSKAVAGEKSSIESLDQEKDCNAQKETKAMAKKRIDIDQDDNEDFHDSL